MSFFRPTKPPSGYPLCDGVTLRVPVVQASLGPCDGPRLAARISRAGALGTLTVHSPEENGHRRQLAAIRAITTRPVLLAFTAEWERDEILDASFAAGFRHYHVFWWNGPRLARRIRARGGIVFYQLGRVEDAEDALQVGADVLVAQGTDAGGQVRSPLSLEAFIPGLRDFLGERNVPIVAGGGLADRHDVRMVLAAGANAALLGTRFLLSQEATAPLRDKRRLERASAADLALDPRLIGDWPCAPRRRLISDSGDDRPSLYAGLGLGRMHSLLPAAEIVSRLAI